MSLIPRMLAPAPNQPVVSHSGDIIRHFGRKVGFLTRFRAEMPHLVPGTGLADIQGEERPWNR